MRDEHGEGLSLIPYSAAFNRGGLLRRGEKVIAAMILN